MMAPATEVTVDLLHTRDGYRALKGDRYDEAVEPCRAAIRQIMAQTGLSAFEVVLGPCAQASADGEDGAVMQLIAAAVDLVEGME